MNWYLAKLVYRIICGEGTHRAQFDQQLRLITACSREAAFEKAIQMGKKDEDCFLNNRHQTVSWIFINICELYALPELKDGTELYSRIEEVEQGDAYEGMIHQKATALMPSRQEQLLEII